MPKGLIRGRFITVEGGEGSGKSTLINRLKTYLSEQGPVIVTREPGGTPLGEEIRRLLLQNHTSAPISPMAELLLFLSARAQHLDELIRPALIQGKTVICDRFNDSTIAYQGTARNIDLREVQSLCDRVCGATTPDLTLLLDIDPRLGLKRARDSRTEMDRMEMEQLIFHEKVREAFRTLAASHPDRIVMLDASQPADQVFAQALQALRQKYA